jgi:hypothetical protein
MSQQDSSWPPSLPPWPPHQHSNATEHRLTIVEMKVDTVTSDHDKFKDSTTSKLMWLERGLQALAYALLGIAFWLAPSKAQGIAELILGLLKK